MAPLLLLLSVALYIGLAGSPALVDDDVDAAHALAREMLERHDFVVLYQDGLRYLIRPPMHFWLIGASYAVLGESRFSTRLPVALSMVGLVWLTFASARAFSANAPGYTPALPSRRRLECSSSRAPLFRKHLRPRVHRGVYLFLRSWTGSLDPRIGYPGAAAVWRSRC